MVTYAQLAFILGLTNLIGLFLVLLTCRCIPGLFSKLPRNKIYMKIFRYHCYFWWIFLTSVTLHAAIAIYNFGIPF